VIGDVRITLKGAKVAYLSYRDRFGGLYADNRERTLQVEMTVANLNENKRLFYDGWGRRRTGVSLVDEHGNSYALVIYPNLDSLIRAGADSIDTYQIHPRRQVTDCLIFERPVKTATRLCLTLPLRNVGHRGKAEFELPAEIPQQ
jgi:hypothetical protein